MIGNNKMETVLITGINGFLGSHIAKRLANRYRIIGTEYQTENLFRLENCPFKVIQSTGRDIEFLFENEPVEYIIHTATFYGRNKEEILQIADTNLFMPLRLLDLAIKKQVKAFINTDTVLDRFVSAYALTKNQFSDWLYFRKNEIKVINMQLEHFFGPGCSPTNFVSAMIERLQKNEPNIDLTKGEQERDFIYYEDIVDAFEIVLQKNNEISSGDNFQIGSGNHITIKDLMLFLKAETGSTSSLNFGAIPYRENELMKSETNIEPLKDLGWIPKYTIKEGLLKTITFNKLINKK
jgi:nucleoside-diphosphate-sugar epimerase